MYYNCASGRCRNNLDLSILGFAYGEGYHEFQILQYYHDNVHLMGLLSNLVLLCPLSHSNRE